MERVARQLILPDAQPDTPTVSTQCSAVNLPQGGVLNIPGMDPITLSDAAVYTPDCSSSTSPIIIANGGGRVSLDQTATTSGDNIIEPADFRDPFYASTFPQCYALAATTVIAYTLVIMLFITPRSFLDGGVVVLGKRGFTSGGTGGQDIGGRPWFQKVAALFVAVSLTIATVDTFRVAEDQYAKGIQNADTLQQEVLGGTELKVIRIISEAFLWLAQAQTLIRLFPRQREKIIIKWTAFALIAFGVLFDSLDSFMYTTNKGVTRPRSFTDAIPALSYLFQLSLGVLYAAWVMYYSLMKKQYAYFHPQMRNIGLVAILSVTAVLVPIVFFILDICKPEFTGWGDYVRWVGAAAASVIVWEWVERIEALEREEKKDGILGREIFDGDEMLGVSGSEFSWPRKRKNTKQDGSDDGGDGGESGDRGVPPSSGKGNPWPIVTSIASRYRQRSRSRPRGEARDRDAGTRGTADDARGARRFIQPPLWPSRPPPVATPVSRTDTTSADSTVYAIRYNPVSDTATTNGERAEAFPDSSTGPLPAVVPEVQEPDDRRMSEDDRPEIIIDRATGTTPDPSVTPSQSASQVAARNQINNVTAPATTSTNMASRLLGFSQAGQLFRKPSRTDTTPATDVQKTGEPENKETSLWNHRVKSRFEDFAMSRAERLRERMRQEVNTEALPVTVIPAPPRRGAGLQQLRNEEAQQSRQGDHLAPPGMHVQPSSTFLSGTSGGTDVVSSSRMWRSHSNGSEATSPTLHNSSGASSLEVARLAQQHPPVPPLPTARATASDERPDTDA